MTGPEAYAALSAQETALGQAMTKLAKYNTDAVTDEWPDTLKATRIAEIQTLATAGGVDLTAWTG